MLGRCKQILSRYSTTFEWKRRTKEFDDAVDKARIRAKLQEAAREGAKSAALWDARKQDTLEEFYQASIQLKRAGDAILRCPILKEVEDEKGETVLEPVGRWALRDASVLMRTSIEIRTAVFEAATKSLDRLSVLELLAVAGMTEEPRNTQAPPEPEANGPGVPITSASDQEQASPTGSEPQN
jgi:hypothetical protein